MRKTSVWALGTMAMLAAVLGAACGGDDSGSGGGGADDVCSAGCDGTVPTFGQLNWSTCTSCHASDAATRTAAGVPSDSDYTTYQGVTPRIREIANRVNAVGAVMPPNGSTALSDADKEAFTKWGCCEGPQ
jgi:uncharacterized membrane protein